MLQFSPTIFKAPRNSLATESIKQVITQGNSYLARKTFILISNAYMSTNGTILYSMILQSTFIRIILFVLLLNAKIVIKQKLSICTKRYTLGVRGALSSKPHMFL